MTASTWAPAHTLLVSERSPFPHEVEIIDRVHQLCRSWKDEGLELYVVRQECSGHERWVATRFTPPQHWMYQPLMELLDALIATDVTSDEGAQYQTPQGTFSEADLTAAEARITKTPDGRLRILFPIRWPWIRRPDPDKNDPGLRDDPVYADRFEERQRIANTRNVITKTARRIFD